MKLFARPGVETAVATMLVLSPANSFALPAAHMAGNVAAAAVRFLASEEIHEARQTSVATEISDSATHHYRTLFESDGWTVIRYSEEQLLVPSGP